MVVLPLFELLIWESDRAFISDLLFNAVLYHNLHAYLISNTLSFSLHYSLPAAPDSLV